MNQKKAFFFWAATALACWKLSFCLYGISFSCLTLVLPLIGAFLSRRSSSLSAMSAWTLAHLTHLPITMGIPTLFATLSWNAQDRKSLIAFHILLPISCMVLFILIAAQGSWPYALYWLIPVGLHFFFPAGLFSRALQSTFIAHALGSVLWALFVPMTAASWLSLIPVVAIERLLMAAMSAALLWILQALAQPTPAFSRNS